MVPQRYKTHTKSTPKEILSHETVASLNQVLAEIQCYYSMLVAHIKHNLYRSVHIIICIMLPLLYWMKV